MCGLHHSYVRCEKGEEMKYYLFGSNAFCECLNFEGKDVVSPYDIVEKVTKKTKGKSLERVILGTHSTYLMISEDSRE